MANKSIKKKENPANDRLVLKLLCNSLTLIHNGDNNTQFAATRPSVQVRGGKANNFSWFSCGSQWGKAGQFSTCHTCFLDIMK